VVAPFFCGSSYFSFKLLFLKKMLHILFVNRGTVLSESEPEELLVEFLLSSNRPVFTMHTDIEAIGVICQIGRFCPTITHGVTGLDERTSAVLASLSKLTPEQAEHILGRLGTIATIGDEFLRLLVRGDADVFGVRPTLASNAIMSFYSILWGLTKRPLTLQQHSLVSDTGALYELNL
jgi:hypothetical protein